MFKRAYLFTGLALALVAGILCTTLFRQLREDDFAAYTELLESSNPSQKSPLVSYSEQAREGVCKEIWFANKKPSFCQMKSESSALFFSHEDNRIEVVEKMKTLRCVIQEELYYLLSDEQTPMQRTLYLEAEKATYNFTTQKFVADEAKLWKVQLEGHEIPSSLPDGDLLISGKAKRVEFSLKEQPLDLSWLESCEDVTLSLADGGQLQCSSITIDPISQLATLQGEPQVHFCDPTYELFADKAEISYDSLNGKSEPTKITLLGSVQMIKIPSSQYALADSAEYFPREEKLYLSGEPRVLFFDQKREIQMVAPSIQAFDNGQKIESKGNVRFVFKPSELAKMQQHFKDHSCFR